MKYKFEDIIYNITEKKKPTDEDRLTYIGLEHLDSDNLFVRRWGAERTPDGEKIVIKKGDVLFGKRRAYQRKVAISPIDGVFSAHGMVLRPKEEVIVKDFLPFFISSDTFLNEAIRISVGGLSPTINWKDIKVLEFNLPSLSEQKVLAKKLWSAYEIKQSYLRVLEAIDELVKSRFIEMFGDQEKNTHGFEHYSLTDVSDFQGGAQPPKNEWSSYPKDGYIRMLQIRDFTQSEKDNIEYVKISSSTKQCDENDVLIGRYGASVGKILTGLAGAYNVAIMKCIPNPSIIDNCYLYYYLTSKYFQDRIIKISSSRGAQAGFNKEDLSTFKIVAPPLSLQASFKAIVQQADKSKIELHKSLDAINKVIKSLINENL